MWRASGAGRGAAPEAGLALDAGLAIAGIGLTALAAWGPPRQVGTVIAGPQWLLAVLTVFLGASLVLRRRAPLLMWTLQWAALALQATATHKPPAGLELMFVLFVGSYSVAAYSSLRRALAGLAVMAPCAVAYIQNSHGNLGSNILFIPHGTIAYGQSHNDSIFFVGEILAFWLLGVFIRARREAVSLAERNAALQRQAERAVAAEQARIARELHDIVAHHLSVVVLQAAGARASGRPAAASLEKIEHSGRQALTEMRRLLSVLRESGDETGLAPQPGVGELAALVESVRGAGLPVRLVIDGDHRKVPAAVDVSAYRIVQEALTNVLKHAGPAHAEVTVCLADGALTIEVTDDGVGAVAASTQPAGSQAWGQGLVGMRERAAIFGGELLAGPRPGGGFAVRARLPLGDEPPCEPAPPAPPGVPAGVAPAPSGVAPASADVPSLPSGVATAPSAVSPASADVPSLPSGVAPLPSGVSAASSGVSAASSGVAAAPSAVAAAPSAVPTVPSAVPTVPSGVPTASSGVSAASSGVSAASSGMTPASADVPPLPSGVAPASSFVAPASADVPLAPPAVSGVAPAAPGVPPESTGVPGRASMTRGSGRSSPRSAP
jgi:signal transduction histidine kinase